jgi:hypothetical protein
MTYSIKFVAILSYRLLPGHRAGTLQQLALPHSLLITYFPYTDFIVLLVIYLHAAVSQEALYCPKGIFEKAYS